MIYYSLNNYLKETFGEKVYKISIDAGFTCPNRDGTLGTGGCIFCSGSGSGDFASSRSLSITEQIESGKARVIAKMPEGKHKFIAYFQAFTNTYAPVDTLRKIYMEAINHPDIVAISIATRPDCLPDEVLDLIREINEIKPVWVELGLQTIHEDTAKYIRRGYELSVYENAVKRLNALDVHIVTHVILGLPGENKERIHETVRYVVSLSDTLAGNHPMGIKLQLLHIIKGTDLASEYEVGNVRVLEMDEYVDLIADCIEIIGEKLVIHRMTGDGDKKTLIAPLWSGDKKRVLNALNKAISHREFYKLN